VGNSEFVVDDKKKLSEILADESRRIFVEKVKLGKFSTESETFFGNGGIGNRGKCITQRDGRPCFYL